jgi:hypothetical protein
VSSIIFYSPTSLYDLTTGFQTLDFSIMWPKIRIFIEPFYSFAFYILTLDRNFYRPVIISWYIWIFGIVLLYCIINKDTIREIINNVFYVSMIFTTIFSFIALIPIPGPKLKKPQGYSAVDIHSHTLRSHDSVVSAKVSLKAHSWQGFDIFFNTEHNHTKGFRLFPKNTLYKTVYPGIQIQTKNDVSVVLLASKEFNGRDYEDMTLANIIIKAHKNKMFVIMPHWWKWHKHTLIELKNLFIDGFEIYNCGYRNFSEYEQKTMINFAKTNDIMMFGVTDWHGWGYMSNVWSVLQCNTSENTVERFQKKPKIKVILYRQKQSESIARFVFDPFYAFCYYMKNVSAKYLASFVGWVIIIFAISKSYFLKHIKRYFPLIMSTIYALGTIYFYVTVRLFIDTNVIIMKTIIPILIGFCILWFVLWVSIRNKN